MSGALAWQANKSNESNFFWSGEGRWYGVFARLSLHVCLVSFFFYFHFYKLVRMHAYKINYSKRLRPI
ncbi:hypothetical protein Hdeb2414_s0004g00127961 [Helianthus debilis subsp. tardiflorus]